MKRLSKDAVTLLNIIANARFKKGNEVYELTGKDRERVDAEFLALNIIENQMYKAVGVTYDEFTEKYRVYEN